MKLYTPQQLCYFARYILETHASATISLQSLSSGLVDWKKARPNEEQDNPMTVDQQLQQDLALTGNAYYTTENGVKKKNRPSDTKHHVLKVMNF